MTSLDWNTRCIRMPFWRMLPPLIKMWIKFWSILTP